MILKSYVVLDLETTYSEHYNRVSNPFVEENNMVMCGLLYSDKLNVVIDKHNALTQVAKFHFLPSILPIYFYYTALRLDVDIFDHIPLNIFEYKYIVIHNMHFDLLWIMRFHWEAFCDWVAAGGIAVCTQFNHYKITHHLVHPQDLALDKLAPEYGGYRKLDIIKALWKAGERTEDINVNLLTSYLNYDVFNTWLLWKGQIEEIKPSITYYQHHWKFMMLTAVMEYFGMHIDKPKLKAYQLEKHTELTGLLLQIKKELETLYDPMVAYTVNINSADQLAKILFGGMYKYDVGSLSYNEDGTVIRYKTGEKKGKLKSKIYHGEIELFGLIPLDMAEYTESGKIRMDMSSLDKFSHIKICELLLKYNKLKKLYTTYLQDGSAIFNSIHPDSCIHGHISHTSTTTGRSAANAPNTQNIDNSSKLREFFCSRFANCETDKLFISADFSGLENRTNAHNSGDPTLLRDLELGLDLHTKVASMLYNIPYDEVSPELRKKIKPLNFGDAYGAGAGALSNVSGLSIDECKDFQKAKKELYPLTYSFYDNLHCQVIKNAKNSKYWHTSGQYIKYGLWKNTFGYSLALMQAQAPGWSIRKNLEKVLYKNDPYFNKVDMFIETGSTKFLYPLPDNIKKYKDLFLTFRPTAAKNFPNQNLAAEISAITGAIMLTKLIPYIKLKRILPIAFVHDEIDLDVIDNEHAKIVTDLIESINKNLVSYIDKKFGVQMKTEFPMEVNVNTNWKSAH